MHTQTHRHTLLVGWGGRKEASLSQMPWTWVLCLLCGFYFQAQRGMEAETGSKAEAAEQSR